MLVVVVVVNQSRGDAGGGGGGEPIAGGGGGGGEPIAWGCKSQSDWTWVAGGGGGVVVWLMWGWSGWWSGGSGGGSLTFFPRFMVALFFQGDSAEFLQLSDHWKVGRLPLFFVRTGDGHMSSSSYIITGRASPSHEPCR